MANHTYDLDRRGAGGRTPDMLANNILTTESMPSEIFVDDYYLFTALLIMLIEEPAFKQRDTHNLEIVGSYGVGERPRLLVGRQRIGGGPVRHHALPLRA